MAKLSFHDIERRMPRFMRRGIAVMRAWYARARWLWRIIARAVRVTVEKEQRVVAFHIDYHRLGARVYESVQDDPDASVVSIDEEMRRLIETIRTKRREIDERMHIIDHMSVTRPSNVSEQHAE